MKPGLIGALTLLVSCASVETKPETPHTADANDDDQAGALASLQILDRPELLDAGAPIDGLAKRFQAKLDRVLDRHPTYPGPRDPTRPVLPPG